MRTRTAEASLGTITSGNVSTPLTVGESWHHIFCLKGNADGTVVKFRGSIQDSVMGSGLNQVPGVDFSAVVSGSNRWGYVRTYNIKTGALVDGATGVSLDNGDIVLVELNINALETVAAEVSAGSADITFRGFSTGE
jgi:hypothetical protein